MTLWGSFLLALACNIVALILIGLIVLGFMKAIALTVTILFTLSIIFLTKFFYDNY